MNYKRIIKNQRIRFAILKALRWIPDRIMLSIQYRIKLGRKCNFKNPQRWTEKLQLYKISYRNPILHKCVDKYDVREYIKNKGLDNILVKLYGVWDRASDIDFNKLPASFVLKTTNGGGGEDVILVRDKSKINRDQTVHFLSKKLYKEVNAGREWAYIGIEKPRIIAEELLVNKTTPNAGIDDYKILCFNGSPQIIIVDHNRYINHKRNFYSVNWERIDVTSDHDQFDEDFPAPKNLDQMLAIAKILSSDFPFVRVDLYNVDGKIYFGELTFYPWAGYVQFKPDKFDFTLGNMMEI